MKTLLFASLALTAVLLVLHIEHANPVSAHGGASVSVTPTVAAPGDQIEITLEDYEADTLVSITLEGISGSIALGTVTTDASGAAMTTLMIPDGVKAGSYSVKAVGGDDEETADLSIKAAATDTSASAGPSSASSDAPADGNGGFTYKQPAAQWVGIAIAAFVLALVGFALVLRRERRA